jgi:hypothetical protein
MPFFSNMPLMGHGPNGIDLGGLSGVAHVVAVVEAVQAPGGSSSKGCIGWGISRSKPK